MLSLFVDISRNYRTAVKINPRARIDYKLYLERVQQIDKIHKAFAYGVQKNSEAESFISALSYFGYEPKYRKAKFISGEASIRETSNNLILSLDVVRYIRFVDTIIIGSNDTELIPLVEWIREQRVKVIIYSAFIPKALKEAADSCIEISNDIIEIREEANGDESKDIEL